VTTSQAAAPVPQVQLDFSSESLGAPITTHVGATIGSAYARTGDFGCRLRPTPATGQLASLTLDRSGFDLDKPYATFAMSFRLVTEPQAADKYMNLFEIGSTSTDAVKSQFTVFFRDGRLVCDFGHDETLDLAVAPAAGSWHSIRAIVDFSGTAYSAEVSYDAGVSKTLTSGSGKTPQHVKVLWIHYPSTPVDYTMDIDDVAMSTSDQRPDFLTSA
jgi:hypothetical protein